MTESERRAPAPFLGASLRPPANGNTAMEPVRVREPGPRVSRRLHSYSNDASLLLPSHSLTRNYVVSSFAPTSIRQFLEPDVPSERYPVATQHPGYISVVGINALPTTVEVVPAADIAADEAGRFPETSAGDVLTLTLRQGEVATLYSVPVPDCVEGRPGYREARDEPDEGVTLVTSFSNETEFDLTGSWVRSDNSVAVFGAHGLNLEELVIL